LRVISIRPEFSEVQAVVTLRHPDNIVANITTVVSFVRLSVTGRREGVHFHRNKWVWFLIVGTLLGAVSSLYDKYLLGRAHFSVPTVRWWSRKEFHWRWSIPFIAFSLLVADYIYFSALRDPASLVSVVMSLRCGCTLMGFAGGLLFFGEINGRQKLPAVIGILVGIVLTVMG
jgi:drug/metabolite transporter (DMT)-like permease